MTRNTFHRVLVALAEIINGTEYEGHLYAVGGCCRDDRLGLDTIKDIDMCLDIPNGGIRFAEWMSGTGRTVGKVITYPAYGTAMFRFDVDGEEIEIECVQTRKEQYRDSDSRNPVTAYGTVMEDAMRRDLTINALYYNVSEGKWVDPLDRGIMDIAAKTIRVTSDPDVVYSDDPLRILRTIRFAARFGWGVEKDTLVGMERNASRLQIISKERIQSELSQILLSPHGVNGIRRMMDLGVMPYVITELAEAPNVTENKFHGFDTVWEHTLEVLEGVSMYRDLSLSMAALLHDVGKMRTLTVSENGDVHFYRHEEESARMTETILRRLKYPNDFISKVKFLVAHHMDTKQWVSGKCDKPLRKLQYKCGDYERLRQLMMLIDADNMACAKEYQRAGQHFELMGRTRDMMREGTAMFGYKLPVNGEDVMELKGLKPGREVKKYLDYLLKLAMAKPRMTKDECLRNIMNVKL